MASLAWDRRFQTMPWRKDYVRLVGHNAEGPYRCLYCGIPLDELPLILPGTYDSYARNHAWVLTIIAHLEDKHWQKPETQRMIHRRGTRKVPVSRWVPP